MLAETKKKIGKTVLKNTAAFAFAVVAVTLLSVIFGQENSLPVVGIVVALMLYPSLDLGVYDLRMAVVLALMLPLIGFTSVFALSGLWVGMAINFFMVLLILALTTEPLLYRPSLPLMLCYVFAQGAPVKTPEAFAVRMACMAVGGVLVFAATFLVWRKKHKDLPRHGLKQQMTLSLRHKSYVLRMALGIMIAGMIGEIFGLKKSMWISVVVLSLTQIDIKTTRQRIKYRVIASIVGVFLFLLFCQYLIPQKYVFIFIIFLGYLSSFVKEYKYAQVLNTINALNANLVLFDTQEAIGNRFLLLAVGIAIVLLLFFADKVFRRMMAARRGIQPEQTKVQEQETGTQGFSAVRTG